MAATTDTASRPSGLQWRSLRIQFARSPEAGALIGFIVLYVFFSITAGKYFLTQDAWASILTGQGPSGIVAVGIAMLMISGEFDLSVGSILGVSSLVFLSLVMSNVPAPIAAIAGIMAGATMGLLNGLILVWSRIPSFIVTLGTLQVYRAISLTAIRGGTILRYADYDSKGQPWLYFHPLVIIVLSLLFVAVVGFFAVAAIRSYVRNYRKDGAFAKISAAVGMALIGITALVLIGATLYLAGSQLADTSTLVKVSFFDLLDGRFVPGTTADFRMVIVWWLFVVLIFTVILSQTRYGSATYATGGNAGAASAQGIAINRVRIINFVISGALAGLAGVIAVGRQQSVNPTDGMGLELEVIAAAVIGGTLLSGGFGSIIGATLGVLIEGVLQNGLVFLSVPSESFTGYIGAILIITVIINTAIRRVR